MEKILRTAIVPRGRYGVKWFRIKAVLFQTFCSKHSFWLNATVVSTHRCTVKWQLSASGKNNGNLTQTSVRWRRKDVVPPPLPGNLPKTFLLRFVSQLSRENSENETKNIIDLIMFSSFSWAWYSYRDWLKNPSPRNTKKFLSRLWICINFRRNV